MVEVTSGSGSSLVASPSLVGCQRVMRRAVGMAPAVRGKRGAWCRSDVARVARERWRAAVSVQ
eukprot:6093888-Lingulodinium_polyedra.AAC.1